MSRLTSATVRSGIATSWFCAVPLDVQMRSSPSSPTSDGVSAAAGRVGDDVGAPIAQLSDERAGGAEIYADDVCHGWFWTSSHRSRPARPLPRSRRERSARPGLVGKR